MVRSMANHLAEFYAGQAPCTIRTNDFFQMLHHHVQDNHDRLLEIVDTDPGLKGDTAQGGTKPATLSTGAVVKVPLFLSQGEVVRVDTRTGEYLGRAKS